MKFLISSCHSKYKSKLVGLLRLFWETGHGFSKIHGPNTDHPKKAATSNLVYKSSEWGITHAF